MKIQIHSRFIFLLALAGMATTTATAATRVDRAEIIDNGIRISGTDAPPYATIRWQGDVVGQADQSGAFEVRSARIPHRPQCTGTLVIGEWAEELPVIVENCRGGISGFYVARQDQRFVLPGDYAYVRSVCEAGDFAVSGNQVISGSDGDPADFRVMDSSLLVDGTTGVQSWIVQGINAGTNIVDVRVAAMCAKVDPPSTMPGVTSVPPQPSVGPARNIADR